MILFYVRETSFSYVPPFYIYICLRFNFSPRHICIILLWSVNYYNFFFLYRITLAHLFTSKTDVYRVIKHIHMVMFEPLLISVKGGCRQFTENHPNYSVGTPTNTVNNILKV